MLATDQKVFKRALSFVLMDSFPSRGRFPTPILMPLLEDPKMELKTILPLRLGLLTTFHQSAEVNIFNIEFSLHLFPLRCVESTFNPLYTMLKGHLTRLI